MNLPGWTATLLKRIYGNAGGAYLNKNPPVAPGDFFDY